MQLNTSQPDLGQMFGPDNLFTTLYGMQREDQANQNQAQNLSQAQQEQQIQSQMAPAQLAQAQAGAQETQARSGLLQAQTPGAAAQGQILQNQAGADSSIPANVRNNAALHAKLAAMSDDDVKQVENQVTTNMASPDPQVRAEAQTIYDNLPAMKKMRTQLSMEGANSARVAGIDQAGATQRENLEIAGGKYANHTSDYLVQKGLSGNYQQQAGAWTIKAAQAQEDGDIQGYQKYTQLADSARQAGTSQAAAAAYTNLAGKINTAAMGVPMVVAPGQTPTGQPVPQPAPVQPNAPVQTNDRAPTDTGTVQVRDTQGRVHVIKKEGLANLPPGWKQQ